MASFVRNHNTRTRPESKMQYIPYSWALRIPYTSIYTTFNTKKASKIEARNEDAN